MDDYGQLRSAPLLLRYVACSHSYLTCRLVSNIRAAQLDPTNLPLPPIDIRDVLDVEVPDMSGINLRNLLLNRADEGNSDEPASSQLIQRKRAKGRALPGQAAR